MDMKLCRYLFILSLVFVSTPSHAQFYAPETRFHDIAQCHYVVELARVLAWRENLGEPKVVEVTYVLTSEPDGSAKWDIKWLGANNLLVRQFNVSYSASLLVQGPAFYREVFKQMAGNLKVNSDLSLQQLTELYWKGADMAGYSRMASLRAAFDLVPPKSKIAENEFAPQLAGLLPQAAIPSLSSRITLDTVLLGRAAAWLAICESMVKDRDSANTNLDALWSPILFLAGRENMASEIWKKAGAVKPNAIAKCWDILFTQPKIEDAFVFVAKPENRRFMLPIMLYYGRVWKMDRSESIEVDFENLLPGIFKREEAAVLLYDHYPSMIYTGTVSTGHAFSNEGPLFARQDWIDCLRKIEPTTYDFDAYKPELKKQKANVRDYMVDTATGDNDSSLLGFVKALFTTPSQSLPQEGDLSLLGFATAAPLIEMGQREGVGKLIPVSTVTIRDLLNYGWETTGRQMGARWHFVSGMWGVPELAKLIEDSVRSKVSGLDVFFIMTQKDLSAQTLANIGRLQYVQGAFDYVTENRQWWKQNAVDRVEEYTSRSWLNADLVRTQIAAFYHARKRERILPYIDRIRAEGGTLCDSRILKWFADDLRSDGVLLVPGAAGYKKKFAHEQKQATLQTINILWDEYEKMPLFERAKELERLYWQGASENLYYEIFEDYIKTHAYDAAKRFCRQVQPRIESVTFSNSLGSRRFTLAMLEKDEKAMGEAIVASATGSFQDMVLNIAAAACQNNMKAMERQVDECLERYGKDSEMMNTLKGFIPLVPALKDASHPEHTKALDYFATNHHWPTLQWIFIKNAKLDTDESVRFLGGRETDWERQLLVLFLLKDKETFKAKYNDQEKYGRSQDRHWSNMAFILIHYLRNELLEVPIPADQPDLKPAGAMTLSERVHSSLSGLK